MTARLIRRKPTYLQKGIANAASAVFEDGADLTALSVDGAQYSLYDADGTAVLDHVAATWTAATSTASYTVAAASIAAESYSIGYHAIWTLLSGATTVLEVDDEAIICRRAPRAPLTVSDLRQRLSALVGDWELPEGRASFASYIDEAEAQWTARLLAHRVPVHEITSWYGWREYCARLTELVVARDLMLTRSGSTKWQQLYEDLSGPADDPRSVEWAWQHTGYRVDRDEDGVPDTDASAESAPGSYYQTTEDRGWRGF